MIKQICIFLILTISVGARSQDFTFESLETPTEWTGTNGGVISLTSEHYKEGSQSLCWTSTGKAALNVTFPGFIASIGNAAFMNIYSPVITNDTLQVEFLNGSSVQKKALFLINFKGWREFNRAYTEYASTLSSTINSVRLTLKPTSLDSRRIYFDNVKFNVVLDSKRIIGSQWILDKSFFTSNNASLALFANPIDIPATTPTAQELSDLNDLRAVLKRTPAVGNSTALATAKSYVATLNIQRNADGSVQGNVINTSASALTASFMTDLAGKLEVLAAAALTDDPTKVIFQNFVDHVLDQGIAEGCNFQIISSDYTTSRAVPSKLLNILPACTSAQQAEIVKLVRWISFYGMLYLPQDTYQSSLVSDVIYLFTPHMMGVVLNQTNDAIAVRELKAFKRFLERNTEYIPGGGDILKPDGTGFHHNTHYNNYMYAYLTWTDYIYYLKGTQFRISIDAYQRFKKAIISIYTMATLDTADTRHYANTLAGRNPFDSGISVFYSKNQFDKLISIGSDCLGATDEELAAAYNYFFQTTKYNVPNHSYDGFFQFNYSPLGIYRKNNWVATMRAPTKNFWGAEIYNNANRFGRYQSHGALEITYAGTPANSGYPTNGTGGGWDWNVVPGTTSVHYTSWQDMMPYQSEVGRFDQKTKSKNYAGALSWGNCGMFTSDFDQIDTWSGTAFAPTNLTFKKTMYAFDNLIISLGSGVGSYGTYSSTMTTATNLFQNIISFTSGDLILNGAVKSKPFISTIVSTQDNWLLTPQGTGYFVPKGNDPIELRFDNQSTPGENGADYSFPSTTASAAKAYLNHGVKPSGKSYCFVVVPASNALQMQSLSTQMANGGGSIFQINAQSSSVHSITYKPQNITAYSFFGPTANLNFGIVKSTSAEHLLMDRIDSATGRHYFAICNPNLNPQTDATFGWLAAPTNTTLTLAGNWQLISPVNGISVEQPSGGQTLVNVSFNNGEPIYFGLKVFGDISKVENLSECNDFSFSKVGDFINIDFCQQDDVMVKINIYDANGLLLFRQEISQKNKHIQIPVGKYKKGVFLCNVSTLMHSKTFKWIN